MFYSNDCVAKQWESVCCDGSEGDGKGDVLLFLLREAPV